MWIRLPLACVLALGITSSLYSALWGLVRKEVESYEAIPAKRIEFTRLRRDTEAKVIQTQKVERQETASMPSTPRIAISSFDTTGTAVEIAKPGVDARIQIGQPSINVGGSDRDVIPLVRIQPDYPARAASRGVEGWVKVQFTITPAGTVRDPVVVDSEPEGTFDKAAINAVLRWKYNPKVEDGVAVERRGVEVLLSFKMEK